MSFRSILGGIEHTAAAVLGVAQPFLHVADEVAFGPLVATRINSLIDLAETLLNAQTGPFKKYQVLGTLERELPQIREVISTFGGNATWDPALLQKAIDDAVTAKNSMAAFVSSMRKA